MGKLGGMVSNREADRRGGSLGTKKKDGSKGKGAPHFKKASQ